MTSGHRATFLREFLRDPFTVAAVAPSGVPLADLITSPVPRTGDPVVVELGPGTGAFTAAGLRLLLPTAPATGTAAGPGPCLSGADKVADVDESRPRAETCIPY